MSKYKIYLSPKINGIGPLDSNILIVGEAPGGDEQIVGQPFVGAAGEVLNNCLSRNGIPRETVRIENLCPYRPYGNVFEFLLNTSFLNDSLKSLHEYILTYKPTVIAALGNYPMHFLTQKGKKHQGKIKGIGNWRGSILPYVDNQGIKHDDIKVVPTFHPSAVSRIRSLYPVFDADIKRVKEESTFKGLNYRTRDIIINPQYLELKEHVNRIIQADFCHIDIETIKKSSIILSISFSTTPDDALVLDPNSIENKLAISKILRSNVRKIFHFGYFDTTQLKLNGYEIAQDLDSIKLQKPYYWDTYIASHVLEPELRHTLAYETSIRTREPYYKQEGKEEDDQKGWSKKADKQRLYRYNGKDTCVTSEVFESQVVDFSKLNKNTINIFNFEMSAIELQCHISNSGMLIDQDRLELLKSALIARWAKLQVILDGVAGFEVNVKSILLKDWLYKKEKDGGLGMPTRYYKRKVSTNDEALVSLLTWAKKKEEESVRDGTKRKYKLYANIIRAIREIRNIRQRLSMYIEAGISQDGRSRSSYKYGPETGRWAASKYVDGTGYNHQTNPRDPIEVPDSDFEKYKNSTLISTLERGESEDVDTSDESS